MLGVSRNRCWTLIGELDHTWGDVQCKAIDWAKELEAFCAECVHLPVTHMLVSGGHAVCGRRPFPMSGARTPPPARVGGASPGPLAGTLRACARAVPISCSSRLAVTSYLTWWAACVQAGGAWAGRQDRRASERACRAMTMQQSPATRAWPVVGAAVAASSRQPALVCGQSVAEVCDQQ